MQLSDSDIESIISALESDKEFQGRVFVSRQCLEALGVSWDHDLMTEYRTKQEKLLLMKIMHGRERYNLLLKQRKAEARYASRVD